MNSSASHNLTNTKMPYIDQRAAGTTYSERFRFTGKEKDEETGYGYFGARYMDHELMTMWLSVDRYADKYHFISPYAYCAWNPIRLTDPNGDTIVISNNDERIVYQAGMLYNGDDDFVQKAVAALNTLNGTDEGSRLINDLHTSKNTFYIKAATPDGNNFEPSDVNRAMAKQLETDPTLKNMYEALLEKGLLDGGSGGDIFWCPYGSELPTIAGDSPMIDICPATDLGHELRHASDANHGELDDRIYNGEKRKEWKAVYSENKIRGQLGRPLRTHYGSVKERNIFGVLHTVRGCGTFMLKDGQPYLPQW